ncbi:MAG TPA: glycosyltransferase family 39 protein [Phototrophicaceae bacterium]|nr:glycosyltransferase family 39 protein [Phototrophicaceae bacterium]
MDTNSAEPKASARLSSGALIYLGVFAVCAALILVLPPPYSTGLLLVLVVGSLAWGAVRIVIPNLRGRLPIEFTWVSTHRNLLAALLALLGLGLMIAAAFDLRTLNRQDYLGIGSAKMLLGGLAIGAAIHLSNRLPALAQPVFTALDSARRFWWVCAGLGTLLLLVVAEMNGQILRLPLFAQVSSGMQYALMMAGVLLVGYGFGGAPSLIPRFRRLHIRWTTILPFAALIGLALFLRLWNQDGTIRYLLDELHWSDGIRALESRPFLHILSPMSGESPYSWIFPFWQTYAVAVFGHNFFGFRFVSAIVGTLTVIAAFFLADAIFDRKTAFLAALALATFPPHVHFSRVAMNLIADPCFGTLALMFIARALRNNHRLEWALAGVSLGMTQYFYEGGRLLFPPLVIGFVILLTLRGQMRGKGQGLLITLVTAVIVGAPFYYTLIGTHSAVFGRYNDSGLGSSFWQQFAAGGVTTQKLLEFLGHLLSGFAIYGASPDQSVYYGGQQALILDYLLPLFLFGCFYLAWRYPAPAFLIPLWVVATALGNGLLRDTLVSARYYVVLPALAIGIAAGVRYLLPFFEPKLDPKRRSALAWQAVPVLTVGAIAAAQVGYYFGPHLQYFNVQVRDAKPYRDGIDAANRAVSLPGNTQVYLVSMPIHDQNVPRDWFGFLSEDGDPLRFFPLKTVSPDTISPKFLIHLPRGQNYAFFVDPNDTDAIAQIERYFPNVTPPQYTPWDIAPDKEYLLFYVDGATIPVRYYLPNKIGMAHG